ncbi:MAG: hypothetical protein AAGC57_00935 [Pseudomonadota bacterium]
MAKGDPLDEKAIAKLTEKMVNDVIKKNPQGFDNMKEIAKLQQRIERLEKKLDSVSSTSDTMDKLIELKVKQLGDKIEPILHARAVKEIEKILKTK